MSHPLDKVIFAHSKGELNGWKKQFKMSHLFDKIIFAHSKGCVILFFAGSMVGVMSQYFGEPIQCDFKVKSDRI